MPKRLLTEDVITSLPAKSAQQEYYDKSYAGLGSFGIRVSKKQKTFFFIYSLEGKRFRMSLGTWPELTLVEARQQARDLSSSIRKGRHPALEKGRTRPPLLFNEVANEFLESRENKGLKQKTLGEYRRLFEKELKPHFGKRTLHGIGEAEVTYFFDDISVRRDSPALANRARALMQAIFRYAIKRNLTDKNPLERVEAVPEPLPAVTVLTFEQLSEIYQVLRRAESLEGDAFLFYLLSCQPISRVLELTWGDIRANSWHIDDGEKGRRLQLTPPLVEILRGRSFFRSKNDYVFAKKSGKPLSQFSKVVPFLHQRISLPKRFTPGDVRKSSEVLLRSLGIRLEVIQHFLGRKTLPARFRKMAESSHYEHEVNEALRRWSKKIAQIEKKTPPAPSSSGAKVIPLFE